MDELKIQNPENFYYHEAHPLAPQMFSNILVKYERCLYKTVEFEYHELMMNSEPESKEDLMPQFKFANTYQVGGNVFNLVSFKKVQKKYRLEFKIENKVPYE